MTQNTLSEIRLLVVDDDAPTTLLLKSVLTKEGYSVDVANSAAVALSLVNGKKYHVVISDVVMPNQDGLELLAELRKRDPLIQVVMMTAGASMSRTIAALELGAADFVLKPLQMEEMVMIVRLCVAKIKRWHGILRASSHQINLAAVKKGN